MIRHFALAILTLVLCSAGALAAPIEAPIYKTTLLRLPEPATTLAVGNTSIASIALHDDQTVLITGHLAGTTNMLALNEAGQVVYVADIHVAASDENALRVFRNTRRESYNCAPDCVANPEPGDDKDWFDDMNDEINKERVSLTPRN
ncbi:pilus assembly protein N-terminal domain-containing protein [Woodsholea maritima]|uniref:pilus assembly protein N-terminal domain-containing protein n=1 Tax=Woodsholea maritima TaxID=240237 RepID=UPI000360A3EE|nr:pilus assembly protein N-terminal domain-containing protein [Woodsholea maritima]